MFSELALGSCSPGGVLTINGDISLRENVRYRSPLNRKLTSAASCPNFGRERSAITNYSYALSDSRSTELLLPKTYITRKGDLLLFAVIDNELFALVDSSKKSQKGPKGRKDVLGVNSELLSQFGSLEDFVLAIIDYQHKQEKYLYASANRKVFQFLRQAKYRQKIERKNEKKSDQESSKKSKNLAQEENKEPDFSGPETQVTVGSSQDDAITTKDESSIPLLEDPLNGHEFDSLALPGRGARAVHGKIRSPLLERKANSPRNLEQRMPTEYVNFSTKLHQQELEIKRNYGLQNEKYIVKNSLGIVSSNENEEFLFSVNRCDNNSSENMAVSYLLKDVYKSGFKAQRDVNADLQSKGLINANSKVPENSTVLPFVYDGKRMVKRGKSAVIRPRKSSELESLTRERPLSLRDIKSSNLNPRISSGKPAPERRALGLTPSAISLTSDEFSRLIRIHSSNQFSIKLPYDDNLKSPALEQQKTIAKQRATSFDLDSLESWQLDEELLQRRLNSQSLDPIIRQGLLLSTAQAQKRLGLDSDGNELLDAAASLRGSMSSFLVDEIDDDEDKILFSYISPVLRKGSWNPMTSFSFEDSSREMSKDGEFSKESTLLRNETYLKEDTFSSEPNNSKESAENVTPSKDRAVSCDTNLKQSKMIVDGTHLKERTFSNGANTMLQRNREATSRPKKPDSRNELSNQNGRNLVPNLEHFHDVGRLSPRGLSGVLNDGDSLHEVLSIRSLSPRPDENKGQDLNDNSIDEADDYLDGSEYEKELIRGREESLLTGDGRLFASESRKQVPFDAKEDDAEAKSIPPIDTIRENVEESRDDLLEHGSVSNTATNVSLRHSIADEKVLLDENITFGPDKMSDGRSSGTEESKGHEPNAWKTKNKDSDSIGLVVDVRQQNAANGDESRPLANSLEISVQSNPRLQENVVKDGLNSQQNSLIAPDEISEEIKKTQQSVFLNASVFGAKQLLHSNPSTLENSKVRGISESGRENLEAGENSKTSDLGTTKYKIDAGERDLADGLKQKGQIKAESEGNMSTLMKQEEDVTKDQNMKNAKKHAKRNVAGKTTDRQTVELKIDLQVANESSPDTGSIDAQRRLLSVQSSVKDIDDAGKDLRLDGVGGNEENDEKILEDLKTMLQTNKSMDESVKSKKKQAVAKRVTTKAKKKKSMPTRQSSLTKKVDSKNLSPVLDLPKRMETVETMIGRPKHPENMLKASPDTEPEAAIEREMTFENQLEIKESTRGVAVQNVEVKKVAVSDPDKKGAYPPSKPKQTSKKGAKKTNNGGKDQEKLKYEEQMRLLKEKEMEQQRAREAALAKQKILEQEREKYKEDEEEAKKKEDEARKRLAEAKLKAKEEREAKRQADAERRRQLVEQRREERRQKDLELAEKEKEAERMKFERERRAQEVKEQRERLKEQEKMEEEQMLKNEKLEEMRREEEEKRLEEERIKKAQEELERLIEEREYREQLRRVAEAQEAKMREAEEQRRLEEEREQQRITEERERIKRAEYLKLQAELERQKEAEHLADERRQLMLLKAAKRKAELLKRREENMERMFDLKCKRSSQGISRSFTFTYFVHIPRSVWELPIGWKNKKGKAGLRGKNRPISVSASMRDSK